jgi:beta-phosphoglucomutase
MTADIRAFIFDLDGVITDTAEFHFLSWKRLADEQGIPFERQDNEALRGLSRRDSLMRVLKGRAIDEVTAQAWMKLKNDYYLAYLDTLAPEHALPGVVRLLDEAHAAGIKIGLASASKNARPVLDKLGLTPRFDAIGDGYSVVNTKPAPDLFIWVAGRLDVFPQQGVIFEDSEAGVQAAIQAGFWSVGIGPAIASKPTIAVSNLETLTAHGVVEQIENS